jgi:pyruvate dehydrogenase E1 component alpha subunit
LEHDPLVLAGRKLLQLGINAADVESIMQAAREEVAAVVASADAASWPEDAVAFSEIQTVGAGQWL